MNWLQPLARTSWSRGTSMGIAAWIAGVWKTFPTARMPSTRQADQKGGLPSRKTPAKTVATRPMKRSAEMMTVLRLRRSTHTPTNGPSTSCGRKAKSPASAIVMGEELSLASHQISANWTALLPISETVCPAAIVKKPRFQP